MEIVIEIGPELASSIKTLAALAVSVLGRYMSLFED